MSFPYTTNPGGYWTRQGQIIGEVNRVAAQYGSDLTTGFNSIWNQFVSSDQAAVQDLPGAVSSYRNSGLTYSQVLQKDGGLATQLQVTDYFSVVPLTLQQSFITLIAAMKADGQTIQKATLTSLVTAGGSNVGNAKFIVSTNDRFGNQIDTVYAETITVTCTSAGTNYAESFQAVGQATVPFNSYLWPAGSGANTSIPVTDPAVNGLIQDGGFELWTGTGNNTPVNWTILNGAAGVTVFRGTGGVRGSYTANLTSDGSSLTALEQSFAAAINTVYAVSIQAKVSALDGTGIFQMALVDGSDNVLNDDAGNALSYTRNLNGQIGTSFGIVTAFFAMPRTLPAQTFIRYGFSTAPAAAKSLILDLAGIVVATQLYKGGPYAAGFSQGTPNSIGDSYTIALTNSLTSKSFALGMNRIYNTQSSDIAFPSANSPTISDSLVSH